MDKTYFTQKWMNAREEYDMCSRSSILDYYLGDLFVANLWDLELSSTDSFSINQQIDINLNNENA